MDADLTGFLGAMAHQSRARVAASRAVIPGEAMSERSAARGPSTPLVLSDRGFDVIAEVKLRSPSEGEFASAAAPRDRVSLQARTYAGGGAAAVSVLTEAEEFSGHIDHVSWATEVTETPIMRKDFLVDAYQVHEARAAGAAGVLLITRILEDEELLEMAQLATGLGMFALIECFDAADIDRTRALWQFLKSDSLEGGEASILLGVNCRDLTTLAVDFERLLDLAPRLPDGAIAVAESGLLLPEHATAVAGAGYSMALVGSALMRAADPGDMLASMLAAGRKEVGCASA